MSTSQVAPSARAGATAPVLPSDYGCTPERWPLRNAITLGALECAVSSARAHVRQLLCEWGRADLAEDAVVVVSELVTNAVVASAALQPAIATVQIWLGSDADRLLVAVADASAQCPVRLKISPDAEGGRGLALVEALSSRWGWYPATTAGLAKVVWAEWRLGAQRSPLAVGPLETAIMRVMLATDSWLTVRDIRDRLDYRRVGYTTVARAAGILYRKGLLVRRLGDRGGTPGPLAWWYRAARPAGEHVDELIAA